MWALPLYALVFGGTVRAQHKVYKHVYHLAIKGKPYRRANVSKKLLYFIDKEYDTRIWTRIYYWITLYDHKYFIILCSLDSGEVYRWVMFVQYIPSNSVQIEVMMVSIISIFFYVRYTCFLSLDCRWCAVCLRYDRRLLLCFLYFKKFGLKDIRIYGVFL